MENRELQQCISLEGIKDFESFEIQVIKCVAEEKKDSSILFAYKGSRVIEREFSLAGAYFNFEKGDVFCKYSGFVGSVDLLFGGVSIGGSMIYFDQDGRLEFIEAYFWDQDLFFLKLERELALRSIEL